MMELIDAVFICDDKDNLVFQYISSLSAPTFAYVQARISRLKLDNSNNGDDDELLAPVLQLDDAVVVTMLPHSGLQFYVVAVNEKGVRFQDSDSSEDEDDEGESVVKTDKEEHNQFNPLITIEFIKIFIEVLETYITKPITSQKLLNKAEIVNLILQNMIDFRYPYITDLNQLREMIPRESIINKIISQTRKLGETTASQVSRNSSSNSISSSVSTSVNKKNLSILQSNNKIPWRRANVKHTKNEMFVDLFESINVIFPPQRYKSSKQQSKYSSAFYNSDTSFKPVKPISATISGEIFFNSHLSGIPDLELVLDLGRHDLGIPSFHRCVRIGEWDKSKRVSFIPPDGNFKLMSYEIDLLNNSKYSDNLNEIMRYLGLVDISFQIGLGSMNEEFEIKLNLQMLRPAKSVENLCVDIYVDQDDSIKTLKLTHGDLIKRASNKYQWIFDPNLNLGVSPVLHGIMNSSESVSPNDKESSSMAPTSNFVVKFPSFVKLNYSHKNSLASGLKVSNLQILSAKGLGDTVKPFKGVKYNTKTGEYILR